MEKGIFVFAMAVIMTLTVWAVKANNFSPASVLGARTNCTTISSGTLTDSVGQPITEGYDQFGYNYQAHMFNGTYDGVDRVLDGKYYGQTGEFVNNQLEMKWSDSWLSNVDCNQDGKLDRGLVNGIADGTSKGWLTNHENGYYTDEQGSHHYTYFVKIGWIGPGGNIWGQYNVLQENYQEPGAMSHVKLATPGLGLNDQWTQQ